MELRMHHQVTQAASVNLDYLTTQQRRAVLMLIDYTKRREIARLMGIVPSRVTQLLASARKTLGCESDAEMCRRARAAGITP